MKEAFYKDEMVASRVSYPECDLKTTHLRTCAWLDALSRPHPPLPPPGEALLHRLGGHLQGADPPPRP